MRIEVGQAHTELRYAEKAIATSKLAVGYAEEAYRAMDLKFQNGLAATTDLITSERGQTRARATLANLQGDVDHAWLRLRKATGGRVAL